MTRYFLPFLFLLVATPGWAASELTGKTLIDSDVVTVGDLFTNAGSHASHVLAPTPKAGDKLILNKTDLLRVANAFKLQWFSSQPNVSVVLERNATLVPDKDVTAALMRSPLKDQINQDALFTLSSPDSIVVQGKHIVELAVTETRFDPQDDRFNATLQVKSNGKLLKTFELSGIATVMASVPVLKYPMAANTTVEAAHLTEIQIPKKQLSIGTFQSRDELIGMVTRRTLPAGKVLGEADIVPPLMIKRNDLVNVTYRRGSLILNTKARAIANGSRGDTIQLVNPTSKKSFEAKVTGPRQAEVNLEV